jgi:hypothetical protein
MNCGYFEQMTNSMEEDVETLSSLSYHPFSPGNDNSGCRVCKK